MYNDRPDIKDGQRAMAGLSANDTRAQSNGPVAWADPVSHVNKRWEEKYVQADDGHIGVTAWTESKGGMTSDIRDKLLHEKEGGASLISGQAPPKPQPHSPFVNHAKVYARHADKTGWAVPSSDARLGAPPKQQPVPTRNAFAMPAVQRSKQGGYGYAQEGYWGEDLKKPSPAAR